MDTNENRLLQLREIHRRAVELAQNKTLRKEDLKTIQKLWSEQESCLKEAQKNGNPTVQEMILDLKIILSTGTYVGKHLRDLKTSATTFSPSEYAEKLVEKFRVDEEVDWWQMASDSTRIINRAPGFPLLLGTFTPTNEEIQSATNENKKKVSVRVSKEKDVLAEKQTAGKVENISEDKDSVDIKVKHILKVLQRLYNRNGKPISFYRFVLHPENFTTTVENIFYISFVIRDGLARLDITDNDELVISPLEAREEKKENSVNKHQMVFSITMDEWKELVAEYDIREPLIK